MVQVLTTWQMANSTWAQPDTRQTTISQFHVVQDLKLE
jgi:hypothetical protein